jgi:hypothetical protein
LLQRGQNGLSQIVAIALNARITRIFDIDKLMRFSVRRNERSTDTEEGTHQRDPQRMEFRGLVTSHPKKPCRSGATDPLEKDAFDLIVSMMGDGHEIRAGLAQSGIPMLTRDRLDPSLKRRR